jgi:cysteine dioxygenase
LNTKKDRATIPQDLDGLINALSEGERTTYNHLMHAIKLDPSIFKKYTSWSEHCYTRNCIVDSEKYELILICWCAGQTTPIHDHDGEECWVKVITGAFKETIYKENDAGVLQFEKTGISKANEVTYMKDFMGFHTLENISNQKSMSLHLYAKPIRKCRVFDATSETFANKELGYDTFAI